MKKELLLTTIIIFVIASNSYIFSTGAPLRGTVDQIREQKAKIRKQLDTVINQLSEKPDNFEAALEIIHNASLDRQWISAEIAKMAIKLFELYCGNENFTSEMLTAKLQALQAAAPRLSDSIALIEKNCKRAIAYRKAAKLPMDEISNQWTNLLSEAKTHKSFLEDTANEAKASIEPLQKAVADVELQDAVPPFKKIEKWLKTATKLQDTMREIEMKKNDPQWQEALALGLPELEKLDKETAAVASYSTKASTTALELQKGENKVKDKAQKNARVLEDKVQDAQDKESRRQAQFKKELADITNEAQIKQMYKQEAQEHADANKDINKIRDEMNQWRLIAGLPKLP